MKNNIVNKAGFIIQLLLIYTSFFLCDYFDFFTLPASFIVNISMDYVAMGVCAILYGATMALPTKVKADRLFMLMIFVETVIIFSDECAWLFQGQPKFSMGNLITNFVFYNGALALPLVSWFYQIEVLKLKNEKTEKFNKIILIICIIYETSLIFNNFFGFFFSVDFTTGIYSRSKYFLICVIPTYALVVVSLYYVIRSKASARIKIPFIIINITPYISATIQIFTFGLSFQYITALLAIILVYTNVQSSLRVNLQNAKTQLMVSQIQPHFLFNTLATIQALCEEDSKLAAETINKFSRYLRGNIMALDDNYLVPFEKEIEHVKCYVDIEKLRFDNVEVSFNLQDTDFYIPYLSIQPIVENAIRHGVRIRDEGMIKIESYKNENYHVVTVSDNGKGFDVDTLQKNLINGNVDEHVGIRNVYQRILSICNGKMEFVSSEKFGTSITIKIPLKH
ncbi:MAG: histidine kinase [Treponema sp.]|nr:histidine kinase [Treponema sp.]